MSQLTENTVLVLTSDYEKASSFIDKHKENHRIRNIKSHKGEQYSMFAFDCNGDNPFMLEDVDCLDFFNAEFTDGENIYGEYRSMYNDINGKQLINEYCCDGKKNKNHLIINRLHVFFNKEEIKDVKEMIEYTII